MADNTQLNVGTDGDIIASDDIGGVKHQLVKLEFGNADSATMVSSENPLPVTIVIGTVATHHITATAAVNTAVTATLPAAGVGMFHYITSISLVKLYAALGVASGAGIIITSTNLPGSQAWTTEQRAEASSVTKLVIEQELVHPKKSSVANTATTLVAPAQAQTVWRWNVSYFIAA